MSWREVSMSDICSSFKYGKMPPKTILSETGFPIFSGYRVTGYSSQYLYEKPQLVLVARGVGGTGDIKISPPFSWITNLSIVLSLDEDHADLSFMYYKLGLEPLKERLNTGAAQAQITVENLKPYRIRIPDLPTQERIAGVLSAYDDLIENNRRRIALLEQAARLLYREWFVHFRFPGYETAKFVDGLPEGWEIKRVADFGNVITGKTPSKKNAANFGGTIPFIKTPDMHGNVFVRSSEETLSDQGAKTQPKKTLPERSILVSCIGTVGVVSLNATEAQTNQQINAVVPGDEHSSLYGFFALQDLRPRLEAIGGGVTMANVSKGKFESVPFLIPSNDKQRDFDELAEPIFNQILKLADANAKLAKARDLLLPRLMDGRLPIPE